MEQRLGKMILLIAVVTFLFSTAGFFLTEGKKELLYGLCSILCAACTIVQIAIVF